MNEKPEIPVALTLAGFDGSGGAGVLADCRTFERMGVYGAAVLSSIVAQSPGSVSRVEPVSAEVFMDQLDEISRTYPVKAAKTGVLLSERVIDITKAYFASHPDLPYVVDPVFSATAGTDLASQTIKKLFYGATLVTPNIVEAGAILGKKIACRDDVADAARGLHEIFGVGFLVKGGHFQGGGDEVIDLLCVDGELEILSSPKLDVPELHGTGCTLSAAITAGLAKGKSIREAVVEARSFMQKWMEDYHTWYSVRTVHALNAIDDD